MTLSSILTYFILCDDKMCKSCYYYILIFINIKLQAKPITLCFDSVSSLAFIPFIEKAVF
jgi:hypothetical protein